MASVYDAAKVNLVYRSANGLLMKKLEMNKGENNLYSTVVPNLDVWSDTFTYWFEIEQDGKMIAFQKKNNLRVLLNIKLKITPKMGQL